MPITSFSSRVIPLGLSVLLGFGAVGCGSDDDETVNEVPGPRLSELVPGWNAIEPGGETICARGEKFTYFVRPGTVNRVVIDFAGGGACWSANTCIASEGQFFEPRVDLTEYPFVEDESKALGIYDHTRAENPVKDWTHVFIPYCTGDVHWGNTTATYGDAFVIHPRGAVNARAVLNWVYANFPNPEQIFVTGWSAGGYGATMWAPHVRKHYDDANVTTVKIAHFSDSAAGVIQPAFFVDSVPNWKPESAYPLWIPNADPKDQGKLSAFYAAVGAYYPDMPLSQFNPSFDATQSRYYKLLGGASTAEWSNLMNASLQEIETSTPSFTSFVSAGEFHTVLRDEIFYTLETEGTKLHSWISRLIAGELVESVHCADCGVPPAE